MTEVMEGSPNEKASLLERAKVLNESGCQTVQKDKPSGVSVRVTKNDGSSIVLDITNELIRNGISPETVKSVGSLEV